MRRALKICGFLAFAVFLFLVAVSLAFYHLVRVGEFRRFLISQIEQQADLRVQLGEADLEIGKILGVSFRDLTLSEPRATQPEITAERMTARVAFWPLLRRELIFYEVRLERPVARLARDKEGRVPLIEKLLNFVLLKQEQARFALDLRAVKIYRGEVYLQDQESDRGPGAIQIRGLELDLGWLRGEKLRELFGQLLQQKRSLPSGPAIEFNVKGTVQRGEHQGTLRAKGKVVLPDGALDYRKAWWNGTVESTDLSPKLLLSFVPGHLPIRTMSGFLAPRLQIEGSLAERMRLKGQLGFMRLAVDAPALFSTALSPGDGRAEFDLDWARTQLTIRRMELRSNEIKFAANGEVRALDGAEPQIRLSLSAPPMPLNIFVKYLPLKFSDSPQFEKWLAALEKGDVQLNGLEIDGSVSEVRAFEGGPKDAVRFDASLRNASARLAGEGYLPLRDLQGRFRFEQGIFHLRNVKGSYGQSRLSDGNGTYQALPAGRSNFDFHLVGELDLAQLKEQVKLGGVLGALTKIASSVHEMGGRGRLDAAIRKKGDAAPQFEGKIAFDDGWLRLNDFPLTEVKGELFFSPRELKTDRVRALLSGSPIQARLTARDFDSEKGTFDLAVESAGIKAGIVRRLLLSSVSPQDSGIIRGSVRYQGPLSSQTGRRFAGTLDLINVQLAMQPLLQPLRELGGRVVIDDNGIDFQGIKGLLVGLPANFSGRWRFIESPRLLFDLSAPNLDIGYLLSQLDTESSDFYAALEAAGKLSLGKGRLESFEFSDLKSDVAIERRVWRLSKFTARSGGGTVQGTATIADKPDALAFSIVPNIQGVPVQRVLDWFEAGKADMTGMVNLSGTFDSVGKDRAEKKKNLNGSFKLNIQDGTIGRMRIMVQILNFLDLSRWFTLQMPDLTKKGVRFRSITGDFKVTQGVYSTQNLFVDSDDLRMTGEGRIDVPRDEIDFIVAVRPFPAIDTAINYIPLIGRGIAAIKNSFLVASFNIRGPIDHPAITPAPLSTLSEVFLGVLGIPKNIIGFGGEEKKDEAQKDQPKEPLKDKPPAISR